MGLYSISGLLIICLSCYLFYCLRHFQKINTLISSVAYISLCVIFGSSEIWSDKVSLIHIKGTQRGGEHGGESRQSHGGAEGTKSDRAVVYMLPITLVINE